MKRALLLIVCVQMLTVGALAFAAIPDPVKLESGSISGISGKTPDVRIFKGIPFASSPLGQLRWRPPQPVMPWDGVRKADQFGPRCMQEGGGAARGAV